ncbi:hypothetical protein Purlil1_13624 [Purpureocillium lilacinum]|uniref:Uncharacterized protein n=1 Tax=Purpureocillium lilacinum TaxID=33203 RepID=A0ABR0BDK8_PURLI|nr:hypothetical protein Purlil1_13624 [Purpureocillium lilacinum]
MMQAITTASISRAYSTSHDDEDASSDKHVDNTRRFRKNIRPYQNYRPHSPLFVRLAYRPYELDSVRERVSGSVLTGEQTPVLYVEASSSASPSQPRTSSSPELQAMRACRRFHQGYDTSRNSLLAFQPSKTCISAAGASTCAMHVFSDPCLWVENTYNLLARHLAVERPTRHAHQASGIVGASGESEASETPCEKRPLLPPEYLEHFVKVGVGSIGCADSPRQRVQHT